jgi:hypothetical protein
MSTSTPGNFTRFRLRQGFGGHKCLTQRSFSVAGLRLRPARADFAWVSKLVEQTTRAELVATARDLNESLCARIDIRP